MSISYKSVTISRKKPTQLPTYFQWLPTYESVMVPYIFPLRLIPIDFVFVHKDLNYIFLSILGTKNMVIHNLQIVNNVYKNPNLTPHVFGHWSPNLYECCCIFVFFLWRLLPINYFVASLSHHHTSFSHNHSEKIFAHEWLLKLQVEKITLITLNMIMHQPQSKG